MTTLKYKAYFSKHKLTTVQQLFLLLLHTAYVVLSHMAAIKEEFTELIAIVTVLILYHTS